MKRLQIIDSTTITLFSNLLFKGVGRHPKTGKKKGGIQDLDLGDAHRKPAAYGNAEGVETMVDLLEAGNNGQNNTDVLC